MYASMGITGRFGGAVARSLLPTELKVRAIVRSSSRGAPGLREAQSSPSPRGRIQFEAVAADLVAQNGGDQ
jgi:hypothetical protein